MRALRRVALWGLPNKVTFVTRIYLDEVGQHMVTDDKEASTCMWTCSEVLTDQQGVRDGNAQGQLWMWLL